VAGCEHAFVTALRSERAFAILEAERTFAPLGAEPSLPGPDHRSCPDHEEGASVHTTVAHASRPLDTAHRHAEGVGPSRWTYWRRRIVVLAALVALVFAVTIAVGRVGAQAELADRVAGQVRVEPGQTLWDVAATTAPDGVDVRDQLAAIEQLNQLKAHEVAAWTVVLVPAR
jgi:Tfp pilus assembly protein FimV